MTDVDQSRGEVVLDVPPEPTRNRTEELLRTETIWRAEPPPTRPRRGARSAALIRTVGSWLVAAVGLVGLPVALVLFVGWPLPRRVPTGREALDALAEPNLLTTNTLIKGGAVVLWLLWAATIVLLILSLVAATTRLRMPRVPLPRLARRALTGLLGSITVTAGHAAVAAPPAAVAAAVPNQALPMSERPHVATTPAVVVAPTADAATAVPPAPKSTTAKHIVKEGDTLWDIAERRLGNPRRWPEIFELNENRQQANGYALRDPDVIHVGWTLTLPQKQPAPSRPPAAPKPPAPPTEAAPVPPTAGPPTASPTPATSPPVASTPHETNQASSAPRAEDGGVRLPDGSWLPWAVAAAITSTAALVWLQRRRRYSYDSDEPVGDLPLPVRQLRRAVTHLPLPPGPAPSEPVDTDDPGGRIPVGGLGVVGDGAHAAARAALCATLASGSPDHPHARGEVIIDAATLRTLLGEEVAAGLARWPRLRVAGTVDQALAEIETALLHRARILDEHELTDISELYAQASDEEALPPLLLLTTTPPAGSRMRATAAVTLGARLDITAFIIGESPVGPTVHVDADGHTRLVAGAPTEPVPPRLPVLHTDTAAQILLTLREAHTGEPPTPAAPSEPSSPEVAPIQPTVPSNDVSVVGVEKARLRVLGPPGIDDVTGPGRPLRAKALELAVFLACHPDGMSTRDIGEYLEPDARVSQADQRVHTNASNLRHVFGRAAGPRKDAYLIKTAGRYRLDPATVDVDVWQLRDLLRSAATASGSRRRQLLESACNLYRGPLADGHHYDWIQPHREAVRRWGIEAHLTLADDLLNQDPQAASDLLDKTISLDRYNEAVYVKAMHARHALGDADGIRILERALTKSLADLDAEPHEDTLALAARLRGDQRPSTH